MKANGASRLLLAVWPVADWANGLFAHFNNPDVATQGSMFVVVYDAHVTCEAC